MGWGGINKKFYVGGLVGRAESISSAREENGKLNATL